MNTENNFYANNAFISLIVSKVYSRGEKIILCISYNVYMRLTQSSRLSFIVKRIRQFILTVEYKKTKSIQSSELYTLSQDIRDSHFACFLNIYKYLGVQTCSFKSMNIFQYFSVNTSPLAYKVSIHG